MFRKKHLPWKEKNNEKEKYAVHGITVITSHAIFSLYFLHFWDIWEENPVLEAYF